jgi:hypothetical protein
VPGIELIDFRLLDVDADDIEAGMRKLNGERQSDVSKAHHTDLRGFVQYALAKLLRDGRLLGRMHKGIRAQR